MKKKIVKFLINIIVKFLCRIKTIGIENIPRTGACIAASNHLGRIDAFLAYTVIPRYDIIVQIAKKYQKNPILRFLIKLGNGMWMDQNKLDVGAYREIENRLKAGGILCITPEGTRSKTGVLIQGKPGTSYLGMKYQIPIIPVAIIGSEDHRIIASFKKLKRPEIILIFGKSFILESLRGISRKEILKKNTDEIMCRIAALLPEERRGFYLNHQRLKEIDKNMQREYE